MTTPDTNTTWHAPAGRFVDDPDTETLGDDFQCFRPKYLGNGAKVIAYFPEGTKEGVVLAHWKNDEFVTWRTKWEVGPTGRAKWECYHGAYFRGRERELEAWQSFITRAGINPPANDEES